MALKGQRWKASKTNSDILVYGDDVGLVEKDVLNNNDKVTIRIQTEIYPPPKNF